MLIFGIMIILFGSWVLISNIIDDIKNRKEMKDPDSITVMLLIKGIGIIILGIMMIIFSF